MSHIDRLRRSQQSAARMAKDQLSKFWGLYGNLPADELRDALLTFIPALGERYGDLAAAAAADWYEETKQAATGKLGAAVLADVDVEALVEGTRWAVDDLYDGNPVETWRKLERSLLRHVKNAGRGTVRRSATRDGVAFARVPSGAKTCAFCTMLASRGFVYGSAELAGSIDRYHDGCDCQQVPDFAMSPAERSAHDARVAEMDQEYQAAREVAGSGDESAILAEMRRQNPGRYTDSVAPKPGVVTVPPGLNIAPHEMATAERLQKLGFDVAFNPLDMTPGAKNPDVTIDGNLWEFKSPQGASEKNTINDQFKKARKQSQRVVIDLQRIGFDEQVALEQIKRRFYGQKRIIEMIVFSKSGQMTKLVRGDNL
ncbi:hypothetical protein MUN78_10230 [Leucobacter allii]|uniref:tRNA nuclease CdiA C-terminal domain-containing protein n=1 Tax=Leucobacter allii TaxID=2932247 RepID=A0ABY4FKI3_9MICO|nr:hypothetical protein [Leucobacter allii]UOQ56081.1 hypothetical protein MUN78_10230 [Leucobacter allii]